MSWQAKVLFAGEAQGVAMRFDAPISFWGGIDPANSTVTLAGHPQFGEAIAGKILIIPKLVGSSSSSAVMLELLHADCAPKALVLGNTDAILPIGVLVANEMGWPTIPVVQLENPPFSTGDLLQVTRNGSIEQLTRT